MQLGVKVLSTALLRFLHGERSGKQGQPPGWATSCTPPHTQGSVLHTPLQSSILHTPLQGSVLHTPPPGLCPAHPPPRLRPAAPLLQLPSRALSYIPPSRAPSCTSPSRDPSCSPPSRALSCSPPPRLRPAAPSKATAAGTTPLALITFPVRLSFPSITLGLWVHPPIPAGSIPTAGCWLAGPGQEASSLCSPQAEWHHPGVSPGALQLCSLSFASTSSLASQMRCRPECCPLHGQGITHHPLNCLQRVCPLVPGLHLTLPCVQPMLALPTQTLCAEKPAESQLQCRTSDPHHPVTRVLSVV